MIKIKQTILYLVAFVVALFLLMVVVNLPVFDEKLLPEVQAIKNIKAQAYGENNAYPATLALNSPPGPSLNQATETIRSHLNQQITENGQDYLSQGDHQRLVGKGHDDSWKNLYYDCKSRIEKNCMAALIADLKGQPVDDKRLSAQLIRYADLIKMTAYRDATQIDINAPHVPLGSIQQIKRIFLAEAYLNQPSDVYVKIWSQDAGFWRMILAENHILITQMIAVAAGFNSVDSLSTAIRQGALNQQQLIELQQIKSLSKAELDMSKTFDYELKYSMSLFEQAQSAGGMGHFMENLFYQPQATINLIYENVTRPLKQVSSMNGVEFYQHAIEDNKAIQFSSPFKWSPATLYNPVGKQSIGYVIPAYTDYIARVHDLNGMIQLLKLQIEIALKPDQSVASIIKQSKHNNPYTSEPFFYNKDTHSIGFECLDKRSSCELDL